MDTLIGLMATALLFACIVGPVLLIRAGWRHATRPQAKAAAWTGTSPPVGPPRGTTSSTPQTESSRVGAGPVVARPAPRRSAITGQQESRRESEALVDGLIIGHALTRSAYQDRIDEHLEEKQRLHRELDQQRELAELGDADDTDLLDTDGVAAAAPDEQDVFDELDERDGYGLSPWGDEMFDDEDEWDD